MPLYGGIALHANNSVVVILDEQDQTVYHQRLANHLPTIMDLLDPYQADLKGVVIESTYNWYWLVDGLMEADYRVHLANPAAMQQYSGLKYTDDYADAQRVCCASLNQSPPAALQPLPPCVCISPLPASAGQPLPAQAPVPRPVLPESCGAGKSRAAEQRAVEKAV